DSTEDLFTAGVADNKPAVLLVLFRSPGANIIETVERVNEVMPQLAASLPAAVDLRLMLDRSPPIRASLRDVERALLTSVALVILPSLLVSITTRPAMCAALLRHQPPPGDRRRGWSVRIVDAVLRRYGRTLTWALRHPRTMLLVTALTVAVNVGLFIVVPKG